jgi:hypothetical protein
MESPERSPDDVREEAEQGGYDESEAYADADGGADEADSPPDQDTSDQTGAEQGGGF